MTTLIKNMVLPLLKTVTDHVLPYSKVGINIITVSVSFTGIVPECLEIPAMHKLPRWLTPTTHSLHCRELIRANLSTMYQTSQCGKNGRRIKPPPPSLCQALAGLAHRPLALLRCWASQASARQVRVSGDKRTNRKTVVPLHKAPTCIVYKYCEIYLADKCDKFNTVSDNHFNGLVSRLLRSINQSVNQKRIRVTKVTNVTARLL